jgi:hypothetical protein
LLAVPFHVAKRNGNENKHRFHFGSKAFALDVPRCSAAHFQEQTAHQYSFAVIECVHGYTSVRFDPATDNPMGMRPASCIFKPAF